MTLRNYTWIALVIFLLGLGVMAQGWNRAPLKQKPGQIAPGAMQQQSKPMDQQSGPMNSQSGSMNQQHGGAMMQGGGH